MKKKGETLGSLKETADSLFNNKEYEKALEICNKISISFPKNPYGYLGIIKAKTKDYSVYLEDDEIKELKTTYKKASEILKKSDLKTEDIKFNEYLNDCKEVENLKKVRLEITGKFFIKAMLENKIMGLNKEISMIKQSKKNGKKVSDIYDFIYGLFFVICLIYSLFNPSYLLILTIPFGIFGLITIYKFIDDNFIRNKVYRLKKHKALIEKLNGEVKSVKVEIAKIKENMGFLNDQKITIISKIPETFLSSLESLTNNNEKETAINILSKMDNKEEFRNLVETYTNLDSEVYSDLESDIKIENYSLESKKDDKKFKLIYMKKIKLWNIILTILLLALSVLSSIILYNNFYELNGKSFVFGLITGIVSLLIYNINTGKNKSLTDVFNDNLLSTVFNASLVYDLVYISITKELSITYGFLEVPMIFLFLLIGYVMLFSLLKYANFIKKLRRQ